jgi:flagellar export protein FliJ
MSCWVILERRARAERDKAAEAVSEVRGKILEQQALCDRTREIAAQYQNKITATQGSAIHFGDIQLYRSSFKQMQQAISFIQTQIANLESELSRKQRLLAQEEIERQKYHKLIEREKAHLAELLARREARELDGIGVQLHYRKTKLA